MKVLVAGDFIEDVYLTGTCERICPESPVPVLVPNDSYSAAGGAALVAAQLREFLGDRVKFISGSDSKKLRIFGNEHLLCRIDQDSVFVREDFGARVCEQLSLMNPNDALVISDYGKGAFSDKSAGEIMDLAVDRDIDVFVDAKRHWGRYMDGAFALFPNQQESSGEEGKSWLETSEWHGFHLIQKLGAAGCAVNGQNVPATNVPVRDTTGAGDIFLAAFVAKWAWMQKAPERGCGELWRESAVQERLEKCATFANEIAGESVKYLGTHVMSFFKFS